MSEPAIIHEMLQTILIQTFGLQGLIEESRVLNHQGEDWVFFVRLAHPAREISVKLAHLTSSTTINFERTAMLHRLITEKTSVPMAEILAVDITYKIIPYRVLIKDYIAGEQWATVYDCLDETERTEAFRQLGQAIAEIHSITLPQFGDISATSDQPPLTYFEALIQRVHDRIKTTQLQDMMLSVIEARKDLFAGIQIPRLCHDDLHHYNVLFHYAKNAWSLATILDFDKAYAGDPESDLARLDLWTHMMHPMLRAVYEAAHPINTLYPQRRPVHQLLWCLEYAQSTPDHLSTTRDICQELGIPPLASFG